MKVLLVDDEPDIRKVGRLSLVGVGKFEDFLDAGALEGIELARSQRPDLILMDMSLPVLDGWEATRRLKASEATARIPVIALTAHAMAGDREKALDAGCNDYDTKPIELPRLLAKIKLHLPS